MKYIILFLFISSTSFAQDLRCSALFSAFKPSEVEIDRAVLDLYELRTQIYNSSGTGNKIAHSLFREKEQELLKYFTSDEIKRRLHQVAQASTKNKNSNPITRNTKIDELLKVDKFIAEYTAFISSLNYLPPDQNQVLHFAIAIGREEMIKPLIVLKGINPNGTNSKGETAIQLAAGDKAIFDQLIQSGANIKALNRDKESVLLYATDIEVVKYLLNNGFDINDNSSGKTLLHRQAMRGNPKYINELIDLGADVNIVSSRDTGSRTPIFVAAEKGNLDVVMALEAAGADLFHKQRDQLSLLHIAIEAKKLDIVKFLIEKGLNVNEKDGIGESPLKKARESGDKLIEQALIKAGAIE